MMQIAALQIAALAAGAGGEETCDGVQRARAPGACEDGGPWECAEDGCPSSSLGCDDLARMRACASTFGDIWSAPPADLVGKDLVPERCPHACGRCPPPAGVWHPPTPISDEPRIYVVDGFATMAECDAIFESAAPKLERSKTMGSDGKLTDAPFGRRSEQYTLPPSAWNATVRSVVDRMDAAAMQPATHGQHLTVTQYGVGDGYELHVDSALAVGRTSTALLFLEQPEAGGELVFPWAHAPERGPPPPDGVHGAGLDVGGYYQLGSNKLPELVESGLCNATSAALRIEARPGRLVIFYNHDPMLRTLRPRSLHGSCPVVEGRKRIAQRWYQWHALGEDNAIGTLLSRVESAQGRKWRVDYQ